MARAAPSNPTSPPPIAGPDEARRDRDAGRLREHARSRVGDPSPEDQAEDQLRAEQVRPQAQRRGAAREPVRRDDALASARVAAIGAGPAQDRVRRTDLKAPVHGIVNKLNVTTIGAVVQPGANLMDIIPLDDSLLVEGRIRPQDIAFIRPSQDAVVKISAYDSSVYGSLKGKVERISADTIVDDKEKTERPETFYRVMVRTEKNHLGTEADPLPIIPGMVTTVEILTGEKSVLDYILKPARTLRSDALREH